MRRSPIGVDPAKAAEKRRRKAGADARWGKKRDAEERAVREQVFARDGNRCLLRDEGGFHHHGPLGCVEIPECWGQLTYHHRRKAAAQGAYSEENGVTLCLGHNRWVEDEPDVAKVVLGGRLVVREGNPEWDQLGRRAARGK